MWSPTIQEAEIKNILCYTTRDVDDLLADYVTSWFIITVIKLHFQPAGVFRNMNGTRKKGYGNKISDR